MALHTFRLLLHNDRVVKNQTAAMQRGESVLGLMAEGRE